MNCPECGYVFGPFDKECARCRRTPIPPGPRRAEDVSTAYDHQPAAPLPSGVSAALAQDSPELGIGHTEGAPLTAGRRQRRGQGLAGSVVVILVAALAFAIWRTLVPTGSGVRTGVAFLPDIVQKPAVVSFAAVTTESKTAYSDTTFEDVTRFRIVQPGGIETDSGSGWKPYLPPPNGEQPTALAAARTMEKASFSDTTWIKVHVLLLAKSGNLYDSEDGATWSRFMASDGKPAVGVAAASYAEKAAFSDTTYWHLEVLRLLADGSIESTEGGSWKLFAPGDGKRILSISAASTKEKQTFSDTTWWKVNVFRLLDNGAVEQSEDGSLWKPSGTHPEAVSLAAYNVEEKEAYSDTTWENLTVDYVTTEPRDGVIIGGRQQPEQATVPGTPVTLPAPIPIPVAEPPAPAPPPGVSPAAAPPAFTMKTKAGGGAPPDLSAFKH